MISAEWSLHPLFVFVTGIALPPPKWVVLLTLIMLPQSLGLDNGQEIKWTDPSQSSMTSGPTATPVCGQVVTAEGRKVNLRHDVPVTRMQFRLLTNLKGAEFRPAENCAINVCGSNSLGTDVHEEFIGSTTDYGDCEMVLESKTADEHFYNDKFNITSISCGCRTPDICTLDCASRAGQHPWEKDECAVFFQERNCSSCFFRPIPLVVGHPVVTGYTDALMSLIVRESCVVKHIIPAFAWMWHYQNLSIRQEYQGPGTVPLLHSAYQQNDPETFQCSCDHLPSTTGPTNSNFSSVVSVTAVILGGIFLGIAAICGVVFYFKSPTSFSTSPFRVIPKSELNSNLTLEANEMSILPHETAEEVV